MCQFTRGRPRQARCAVRRHASRLLTNNRINIRYTGREVTASGRACCLPTPSCIACPTSRSCAARRTRRSWSSARRRSGYAALALTDECSLAGVVRAHLAARDAGLPLVIGSEFTLADGMKLVLLRDRPRDLRRSRAADHARAAQRGQGQLRADARRRRGAGAALPRAVAAAQIGPGPIRIARRALVRRRLPRPRLDRAWNSSRAPATVARLAHLQALARRTGLPLVAAGDVAHARARAARAAGHADGDPPAHAARRMRLRALPQRRAPPALARAARHALSARADRRDAGRRRSAARSRSTNCATNIRRKSCRRRNAGVRICASWSKRGCGSGSGTRPIRPDVRELIEHELALIAELGYEPYFLTVHDIVAFARCEGHPVPGPRLGRQFRRLLRARHHRGRSRRG